MAICHGSHGDPAPNRVVLNRRKGIDLSKPAEQFMWFCHEFFGIEDL